MKTFKFFLAAVLLIAIGNNAPAQSGKTSGKQKTETFKVWGKCDMCKERIEKTVTEAGASSASWDEKTKMLTVSFDPSKTNVDAMDKKLAAAGHDNEKYKADDKAYNSLPGCCRYERAK